MTNDKAFCDGVPRGDEVLINGARFRVDGVMHQGSDSRILSAHSMEGGGDSAFVIKRYACPRDGEIWQRAMREIEAGMRLRRCGHILPLLGYSVRREGDACGIFLLFERLPCLDGMTLSAREALQMCRDISLALEEMRKKGLLHGDVKPANIYSRGGAWLLGDLGSVYLRGESPSYGSEGYCSPEAMKGERCDVRSDVYSLGLTLYKLRSGGRLPFCESPCDGMGEEEVYRAIGKRLSGEEIPPLPGLSEAENGLLRRMCAFDRRDRFRRPLQVASQVEKILKTVFSTDNS